jgi:hypothetical protein
MATGEGQRVDEHGDGRPRNENHEAGDSPARDRLTVDRRRFLQGLTAAGAAAAYDAAFAHAKAVGGLSSTIGVRLPITVPVVGGILPVVEKLTPSFTTLLRRREDFLLLRIDGYNLIQKGQFLDRQSTGDAYLVVVHQPQHIFEEAFEVIGGHPKSPGHSKALLAYPSRLAFKVPAGRKIPLTVAGLLDWAALDPSLAPVASFEPASVRHIARPVLGPGDYRPKPVSVPVTPPRWPPRAPAINETAIELPWHLVLSPGESGSWSHPRDVLEAKGWAELWHTRLADGAQETADDGGSVRAIWNFDVTGNGRSTLDGPPPSNAPIPFLSSLNPNDRYQIVQATSDFHVNGRADVTANKLWLSARGGFLDSIGVWDSTSFSLGEWKHLATLGRDQYVKVVHKGFLFPFGHRAVFITVTERMFEQVGGETVATLRQIQYVVIREPTKSYDPADTFGIANNSRDLPFRTLTITTLRSPDIKTVQLGPTYAESSFVPTLANNTAFAWHFVGTDWIGQTSEFTAPAVFVYQENGWDATNAAAIRAAYNALPVTGSIRVGQFTGAEVAFAASHTAGDTNLGVQSITFGAGGGTGGTVAELKSYDQPICYPNVTQAQVTLSAAAQASGGDPTALSTTVSYHPTFVTSDFNSTANKGNLFMEILGSGPPLNFGGGSSGAVITPNLVLSGLSRSLGPIAGDVNNILGGTFDPTSVFAGALNATILGGVKLIDLIQAVTGISGDSPPAQAMQIVYSTAQSGIPGQLRLGRAEGEAGHAESELGHAEGEITPPVPPIPTTKTTNFSWSPDIVPDNPIVSAATSLGDLTFTLDGTVTTDLANPKNSTFKLTGTLTNFIVSLMDNSGDAETFIAITFSDLTFKAGSGQKSHVSVDIDNVAFLGVLEFIEQLEEFMDFSGDGGPKITVNADGITADLAVSLPPIAVGIFSLSNIGVDAGFNLPFSGAPARFRFSFATQDNPFTLSVAIFGGGGFFGIAIGTDGVELIQAAFDFGAMASIDLGVASGSVQLVAGIYFAYGQIAPPATTVGCILTGYVKLDGSLSILGIITLSLEFDLSLTYEDLGGVSSVTGTATLTVGIKILFFSFSVSVTASKTFGGGSNGSDAISGGHAIAHLGGGSDTPPTFVDQMTQTDWDSYCAAFATS